MDQEQNILIKIEKLRRLLNNNGTFYNNLTHHNMLKISTLLDQYLVKYYKLAKEKNKALN